QKLDRHPGAQDGRTGGAADRRLFERGRRKGAGQAPRRVPALIFGHFLSAAHASLSAAKLWAASKVRGVGAWERALPSPLPRFFEKNRVKLLILRPFLRDVGAGAGFDVPAD